jgi:hypothetical protein
MSEEVTNEEASEEAPTTPETEAVEKSEAVDRVPVRELQKERRERQKLEQQLAELQQAQEQARQAELSEVERLKEELVKTQQAATAAEEARVLANQQSLVRTAASQGGFADAEDAITFVDFEALKGLEGNELSQAISDEVARVSSEKPYLLAAKEEGQSRRSVGIASDREGADQAPAQGDDALGGFVHSLLFGKQQ